MYEKFNKLLRQNEPEDRLDILENVYDTKTKLDDKFVVTNTTNRSYYVFNSIKKFKKYLDKLDNKDKTYDEVIFSWMKQKIRLDIDIKIKEIPNNIENTDLFIDNLLKIILTAIIDAFFHKYLIELDEKDIIITSSHGTEKKSFHLIIDKYYALTNVIVQEFVVHLVKLIPISLRNFVDLNVYKKIQNFRMALNHKSNSNRVKKIETPHNWFDTIIQNTEGCIELKGNSENKDIENNIEIEDVTCVDIIEFVNKTNSEVLEHQKFRLKVNNILIFDRKAPSFCQLCNETHHNDNTAMLLVYNESQSSKIYFKCRHLKNKLLYIGNMGEYISLYSRKEERLSTLIDLANNEPICGLFEALPTSQKNIYINKIIKPFEHKETLCVKAGMKMGKTKALVDYVNNNFNSEITRFKIRIVSFRQTFSLNIKEKFKDFTLYSDVKGPLTADKLIIQVESLFRVKIDIGDEPPDLLVLDECESIFEQFNSGLLKNFTESWAVFQYLVKYSKYLVAMDANISDRTYRLLSLIRNKKLFYHCNLYQNALDDHHFITTNKIKWISLIYEKLEDNKKIAIPISSLNLAETLQNLLKNKFPEKKIKLYSSKTSQDEKKEHFSKINDYWNKYDILIYTPTVSAGVSFEVEHFDIVCAYFTDVSCNVETAIQMMGRIRNVGDKEYYICLDTSVNNLPTKLESIKVNLYESRNNLFKQIDVNNHMLSFNYKGDGKVYYQENDYFYLWLENIRIKNLSINDYCRRYISYIASYGCTIDILEERDKRVTNSDILQEQKMIKHIANEKIVQSEDLNHEEVEEIKNKISTDNDLSEKEYNAYQRYLLRSNYNWNKDIDEVFVSIYGNKKIKRIFKNLCRINLAYDENKQPSEFIVKSLNKIQTEEQNICMEMLDGDSKYLDLNRRYVFDQHRIALGLLKICGWTDYIYDKNIISKEALCQIFRNNEQKILSSIREIKDKFGLNMYNQDKFKYDKGTEGSYVDNIITIISTITKSMYGVTITHYLGDKSVCQLNKLDKFSYNYNDNTQPCILPQKIVFLDDNF